MTNYKSRYLLGGHISPLQSIAFCCYVLLFSRALKTTAVFRVSIRNTQMASVSGSPHVWSLSKAL